MRNQRDQMPLSNRTIYSHDECPNYDFEPTIPTVPNEANLLKAKV